jgi:hypothetical protein
VDVCANELHGADSVAVNVLVLEKPVTPSKTEGVLAGDAVLVPLPVHVPVTVKFLDKPLTVSALIPVAIGKLSVEVIGPVAGGVPPPPPPPPHAVSAPKTVTANILFTANI